MWDVWQSGGELARQAVGYLPALAFNLILYVATAAILWVAVGPQIAPVTRRAGIVAVSGLLAVLWLGFLALGLTLAGAFSPLGFYGLWIVSMAAALWSAARRGCFGVARRTWVTAAPLPAWLPWLLLLWLALYSRPFELIVGGRDPGVYVNTAAQISRTGGLAVADPFFARLDPADRAALSWYPPWLPDFVPYRFPGFFWLEDRGEVLPQFVPFYPALMAASHAVTGFRGALTVLPLVSLLFALVLAELAAELAPHTGRAWTPALAAFGLLLNPASYWFGRYANSDVLFGLLIFAALLFWTRAARQEATDGLLAGLDWTMAVLSFGAALLTKIDSWYVAPAAGIALLVYHPARVVLRRRVSWLAWAGVVACYLATAAFYSYPYMLSIIAAEGVYPGSARIVAVVVSAAYLLGLTLLCLLPPLAKIPAERLPAPLQVAAGRLRTAGALFPSVAVAGVGLVAFGGLSLLRGAPLVQPPAILASYLGWPALLLALIGGARQLRMAGRQPGGFVLLTLFCTAGVFIIARTAPGDHPWAIRRAASIAIPSLVLSAAAGVEVLRTQAAGWQRVIRLTGRAPAVVGAACTAALLVPLAWGDLPIFRHMEVAGAQEELALLEAVFPADAVILADGSQLANRFGPPLSLGGRVVLIHYGSTADPHVSPALRERVAALAAADGRPFYLLTETDAPPDPAPYPMARYWWDEWQETRLKGRAAPLSLAVQTTLLPFRVYQALDTVQAASADGLIERYEAEALPGLTGQRVRDAGAGNGWARRGQATDSEADALIFGPYRALPAGRYVVRFRLRSLSGDSAPARLIVQDAAGRLAEAEAPVVADYTDVDLPFELREAGMVEFPVLYSGAGAIWVDRVEILHDSVAG